MFIGVDLGGTNMRAGAVSSSGQVFHRLSLPTRVNLGLEEVIGRIAGSILNVIEQAEKEGHRIEGVGIGSPGIIDIRTGTVVTSPNFPEWKQVPLKLIMENKLPYPVFLDNDANAFAYGEKWVGVGKNVQSMVCMTLGTGVGGAIILDGRLWHGFDGMAGEVGHMTVEPNGLKCNCGNYGCLESYASASAVVRRIKLAIQSGMPTTVMDQVGGDQEKITSTLVYQSALEGDSLARQIMKETSMYLGIGIANLINLLNPEMIIIGGGLANAWDMLYPLTLAEVRCRAFASLAQTAQIRKASLGDDAGIIGAAGIACFGLKDAACVG
ncbi:MAG: ROK family protein [bacterium]